MGGKFWVLKCLHTVLTADLSLMLFPFFRILYSLCASSWMVSIAMASNSLIFSYAVSNLLLIPSDIFFYFRHCNFHLEKFSFGLYIFCLFNMFNLSFSFLNIWDTIKITVLMSLSATSNISVNFRSIWITLSVLFSCFFVNLIIFGCQTLWVLLC